ncbi:hypothetical protein [Marinobacter sp.]|uniref:hypothetical protein n=1 Tax=Marinobacter sp. TaxID=50741 RepID=UPI00384D1AA9
MFAFLFLALAVALGLLYHQFRIQSRMLQEARSELQRLDPGAPPARPPEMFLTVKVVDPIALAKRESKSARLLADRLPVMVKKMVYQQVMKEIREELAERDIEVEINIDYR